MTAVLKSLPAPLPNVPAELRDARREIAIAKLTEFDFQCQRIGALVREDFVSAADAADVLYDAAIANGLVRVHGEQTIQSMLAAGLESEAT
jgi:hypothetical protein